MQLTEVAKAISVRVGGLDTQAKVDAFCDDCRAAGVRDGPALQDAYDRWRVSWKHKYAPTAAQFAEFYVKPSAAAGAREARKEANRKAAEESMARAKRKSEEMWANWQAIKRHHGIEHLNTWEEIAKALDAKGVLDKRPSWER